MYPRKIHLVFIGFDGPMSAQWADNHKRWKALHTDWEVKLWGGQDIADLFKEDGYRKYKATYDGYPHGVQRADFLRYLILHKEGGVYTDMDTVPNANLTPILKLYEEAPRTPDTLLAQSLHVAGHPSNYFMISKPQTDFLEKLIMAAVNRANDWYPSKLLTVMNNTGPSLVKSVWEDHRNNVSLIPPALLTTCDLCGRCQIGGLGYITDQHAGSWNTSAGSVLNELMCTFNRSPFTVKAVLGIMLVSLLSAVIFLSLLVYKKSKVIAALRQ